MKITSNFFLNKKILIYGLGLSGKSSLNFLKNKNFVKFFDDNYENIQSKKEFKYFIDKKKIKKIKFDLIIISPGINVLKCKLKNFLKKNKKKIYTDLDVFYSFYKRNKIIGVTGTNGKSTTVHLLNKIIRETNKDSRAVGNIGNSILNEKNISKKTIFVVELSSYQIEYSQFFKPKYALLINISPDHLERHGTFKNYLKTKLKLFKNQNFKDFSFFDKNNNTIRNEIKKLSIKSKKVHVQNKINSDLKKFITNKYFHNKSNEQNLTFVISICKVLNIKKRIIIKVVNNFKGLKYRQEIIYSSKKLTIINDSKSTSFASTINLLGSLKNVHWLVGGLPKAGDKFDYKIKKNQNIKAYIFGKNKKFFINNFKNKIKYETFETIHSALKRIFFKKNKIFFLNQNIILFSPCSASFDNFKNFEERGKYFNILIKKYKKIL